MKKARVILLATLLCLFSFAMPAFADNQVDSIHVDASINPDGSMAITQVWEGSFDEGTENYIPMNAPDYLTIHDLEVTDQNGAYQTVDGWDIDWSFEEKARKCGIHETDDGYEICFGISQYGDNRYTLKYTLDNVVASYTDVDGVNFRFVNDEMNTTPTDVTITIRLADGTPITDEIADVWGFGYEGMVEMNGGTIQAYTESPITADNHVTVMFNFEKGVLVPARVEDDSFETVKDRAFSGSDYSEEDDDYILVIMAILAILFVVASIAAVVIMIQRRKERKNLFAKFDYFRDIPNEGNLNATYALGKQFDICKEEAILATTMLRLMDWGYLVPITTAKVGFMGRTKESIDLQLATGNQKNLNKHEKELYNVLKAAAGSDGVLQAKEMDYFAEEHDQMIRNFLTNCDSAGVDYLAEKECMKSWETPARPKYLTPAGEKELGELVGLKKYLEDFSLIAERGVKEIPIWKDLLTYAMLFGIADRVADQMRELYPDMAAKVETYSQTVYTANAYHHMLYENMRRAEEKREEERRGGSGGFSSLGGGGGSIGGGSGGGSR